MGLCIKCDEGLKEKNVLLIFPPFVNTENMGRYDFAKIAWLQTARKRPKQLAQHLGISSHEATLTDITPLSRFTDKSIL